MNVSTITNCILLLLLMIFVSCTDQEQADLPDVQIDSTNNEASILENTIADSSDITCPKCGFSTIEVLPTDVCLLTYECTACEEKLHPADGDCCVFCTYGSEKCPSKQE